MSQTPQPGTAAWWEQRYREGGCPWDSGIVPPELHDLVASGQLQPSGTALDLGCGTGTNTLFLAGLGFKAIGVDLAWLAVNQARQRAQAVDARAFFCNGDVANLDFLTVQARFAVDIGCLHSLNDHDRDRYAGSLARRLLPGALYLLYGFDLRPDPQEGAGGFGEGEIAQRFGPAFRLLWRQPSFQGDLPVAWYLLERN